MSKKTKNKKTNSWTIQNLKGDILHTGTEGEIKNKFQSLLLQPGARRMIDHHGNEVAKASLSVQEISFEWSAE